MVEMSRAIRETINTAGWQNLGQIPTDDLRSYCEIVSAWNADLQGELAKRASSAWNADLQGELAKRASS
jgi:hypothetical protein